LKSKAKELDIEYLEDGTISFVTGDMSGEQHKSCDEFLKMTIELLGGNVQTTSTKKHSHHHHEGDHHDHVHH